MARNRIIKPEFWSDAKTGRLSFGARLLYIAMWNFADDYGTISANPRRLLGDVFENDEAVNIENVISWLAEIEAQGMIVKYTAKEKDWYEIPKFNDHQKGFHKSERKNPTRNNETDACKAHAERMPNDNGNGNENGNGNPSGNNMRKGALLPGRDALAAALRDEKEIVNALNSDCVPETLQLAAMVMAKNKGRPVGIGRKNWIEAVRTAHRNLKAQPWYVNNGGYAWLLDVRSGPYNGEQAMTRVEKYQAHVEDRARGEPGPPPPLKSIGDASKVDYDAYEKQRAKKNEAITT